ncbi:MAG: tetratricopeptide repeat protein [Actinomycetia bacterium]|nr:tetratricopeptide repeat protein [Actinomycetes bacterium]
MDKTHLAEAAAAYAAEDWRTAAREYLAAAGDGGPGSGEAFHLAGNALMRLKRFDDAANVYERALQDHEYTKTGPLNANLGRALCNAGMHQRALAAYQRALDDPSYTSRYKALQGLAGAQFEVGLIEDAGDSYRRAALDDANPNPGTALNNLGLCFMALGRPADAVEAYRAAVELEGYTGRGRAAANMGLAYAALGRHQDAVKAFDRASEEFGYPLSGASAAAADASRAALESPQVVEGWSTGEMSPVVEGGPKPDAASTFFTRTDEEMRVVDREARKTERRQHKAGKREWVGVVVWVSGALIVVGAIAFAWLSGVGYPTQTMTVKGLLDAHRGGKAVESYWVAVPSADVEKEMSNLPPKFASYSVQDIERSAKTSTVDVTVVLDKGAPLTYRVSLVREGVGWKVNGVTNDWRSTGSGS